MVNPHYQIRHLELDDYNQGFLDLLSQLTIVGEVSFEEFKKQFQNKIPDYSVFVMEDKEQGNIIATGKLLIEHKFTRRCGRVGHIEDVVVDQDYRGQGLGKLMIQYLTQVSQTTKCYKVILDCAERNVKFYQNCGFTPKEVQMTQYFE